jgi:predicted ATP-grasp superfamily ATP-dependent carboligase
MYFQKWIRGRPCSAVFVGNGKKAVLLGATGQLIGERKLHARPFHYGGSIGPLKLPAVTRDQLQFIGSVLSGAGGLRGLFGIDFVLSGSTPVTVELNPRYTASVEILEYGLRIAALAYHCRACAAGQLPKLRRTIGRQICGKAVLFARKGITFPRIGPWIPYADGAVPLRRMPRFADVPAPCARIERGQPILTVFVREGSLRACRRSLCRAAREVDRYLSVQESSQRKTKRGLQVG